MRPLLAGLSLMLVLLLLSPPGQAARRRGPVGQCRSALHAQQLDDHLTQMMDCANQRLEFGSSWQCGWVGPPACARDLPTDLLALARGPLTSGAPIDPALASQLTCQQQIASAVAAYASANLSQRVAGADEASAHLAAQGELAPIAASCTGVTVAEDPAGPVLPSVGPQCAAATGSSGATVDAPALEGCVGALARLWVERIAPDPQPKRPNIVFIMTDDQRWDTLDETHGIGGAAVMPSVLNELAAEGVTFTHAYATTPLCGPSRSSVLTGQLASTHGIRVGSPPIDGAPAFDDASTLATWLHGAGYRTGMIGKYINGYRQLWQTGEPPYVPPGWDDWRAFMSVGYYNYKLVEADSGGVGEVYHGFEPADYSTDVLRDHALDFIDDSVAQGDPFFLYWTPITPHSPFVPAPRHVASFLGLTPFRPASFNEPDVSDKPDWVQTLTPQTESQMDYTRRTQLEMLQAVDEAVEALVAKLDAHGILDETLIVFTSDNGYYWGEHRLVAKNREYDEAIRIPLVVRYPPLAPLPRVDDAPVANIDFASTFAELVGVAPGVLQDGRSFDRLLDGTEKAWRAGLLTEAWPPGNEFATWNDAQWKYTEGTRSQSAIPIVKWNELYDRANDPLELDNLAEDPAYQTLIQQLSDEILSIRPNWPIDSKVE